jgi:hypothetical protein
MGRCFARGVRFRRCGITRWFEGFAGFVFPGARGARFPGAQGLGTGGTRLGHVLENGKKRC